MQEFPPLDRLHRPWALVVLAIALATATGTATGCKSGTEEAPPAKDGGARPAASRGTPIPGRTPVYIPPKGTPMVVPTVKAPVYIPPKQSPVYIPYPDGEEPGGEGSAPSSE